MLLHCKKLVCQLSALFSEDLQRSRTAGSSWLLADKGCTENHVQGSYQMMSHCRVMLENARTKSLTCTLRCRTYGQIPASSPCVPNKRLPSQTFSVELLDCLHPGQFRSRQLRGGVSCRELERGRATDLWTVQPTRGVHCFWENVSRLSRIWI